MIDVSRKKGTPFDRTRPLEPVGGRKRAEDILAYQGYPDDFLKKKSDLDLARLLGISIPSPRLQDQDNPFGLSNIA